MILSEVFVLLNATMKTEASSSLPASQVAVLGLIAGNSRFPFKVAEEARQRGFQTIAVCFEGETDPSLEDCVDQAIWLKIGQLGRLISSFLDAGATQIIMAGGISRVNLFGGVKLDLRGATLLAKIRSTKDDVIMRAIAEELMKEGLEVISCTEFVKPWMASSGLLAGPELSPEQINDIEVGRAAIEAMSSQHIGQLVVVREGVVVAVEAVEGSDKAIKRGGELAGPGSVVVKFAKTGQDMRFDVPTVGIQTLATMSTVGAKVLALESGRCLMMEKEKMILRAKQLKISICGCDPLV